MPAARDLITFHFLEPPTWFLAPAMEIAAKDSMELDAMYFADLFSKCDWLFADPMHAQCCVGVYCQRDGHRMTEACRSKCISTAYYDGELTKGESVCLDRCVAKYMESHDKVGKKLQEKQAAAGFGPPPTN